MLSAEELMKKWRSMERQVKGELDEIVGGGGVLAVTISMCRPELRGKPAREAQP